MPQFSYRARRKSGDLVQDTITASDRAAAASELQRLGLTPSLIEPLKGGGPIRSERPATHATPATVSGGQGGLWQRLTGRRRRPKLQELGTYTYQLTNLLRAGMPLAAALNSMASLGSKGITPDVSRQLKQDVMEGKSLSDAMSRQPHVFSDLYVNMVRAGEQSGALVEVLQRLSSHYERFAEVQHKFVSALIYPAVVCCVGVVIVIFFMSFMLPKFTQIFIDMKVDLPTSTQILIGMSRFFSGYWWLIPLLLVAGFILYNRYAATPSGRRRIDTFKLRAPVLGKVVQLNLFGQFARTLGTLLQNGVPVLTALKITEEVIPNQVVKEAILQTREAVTDGKTIAQPLARSKLFPQMMIDLIRIGEETGDVPGSLNNVAQMYDSDLNVALRVMTNLIEPALIIVMAVGVGFLLFSVLSAMFTITANIAR
ncbi:MAG: type II secretion system F family protein [Limisphaerales bacterium]